MHAERCPYTVRAWWGHDVVAESDAAVRLDPPGESPLLCFPPEDVRLDRFREEGDGSWTLEGDGADPIHRWSDHPVEGPRDGDHVLRRIQEPEMAAGHLTFDHTRVRVEVIDGAPGDDEREISIKRFPTWGDATHLIEMMDVVPDGEGRYVSVTRADTARPVVEGSQMLGQALVAAARHAPGRRAVSAHMVFFRAAHALQPLEFELEELSSGRMFTALSVDVSQSGRKCAKGTLLLDVTAPDVIRHEAAAPPAPGPYDSVPRDMGVTGRDLRVVDGAYTDDPDAPVGPPVLDAWVRFRKVPDDPAIHIGLLTQFTGHMSIGAALRPHAGIGERQAHRTISTAPNAITISIHADVHVDRWVRYHHHCTFAGDGMTHAVNTATDESGKLLASFTVEAMVRAMNGTGDHRTSL